MAASTFTKASRRKLWICRILDFIILFLPVVIYVFIALCSGGVTTAGKVCVAGSVLIAFLLALFNALAQKRLRCPIWIILIGLYIAIREWLLPLIIILAIVTVLDDLVLTPLISHYKAELEANKAIDKRMPEEANNGKSTKTES